MIFKFIFLFWVFDFIFFVSLEGLHIPFDAGNYDFFFFF